MRNGSNARLIVGALIACCAILAVRGHDIYGSPSQKPVMWPAESTLPRADAKATVLMFVRADDARSQRELAELGATLSSMHPSQRPFVAIVLDSKPAAIWEASGLVSHSRLLDKTGVEARRFGAMATGHVVVYDAAGVLRYAGSAAALKSALIRD